MQYTNVVHYYENIRNSDIIISPKQKRCQFQTLSQRLWNFLPATTRQITTCLLIRIDVKILNGMATSLVTLLLFAVVLIGINSLGVPKILPVVFPHRNVSMMWLVVVLLCLFFISPLCALPIGINLSPLSGVFQGFNHESASTYVFADLFKHCNDLTIRYVSVFII